MILFIIGVFVGAIISTSAFYVYLKANTSCTKTMDMETRGTPPSMPNNDGTPPSMPNNMDSNDENLNR